MNPRFPCDLSFRHNLIYLQLTKNAKKIKPIHKKQIIFYEFERRGSHGNLGSQLLFYIGVYITKTMEHIIHVLLAGWCADAAGARLEFRRRKYTEQDAIDAMHFIGDKTTDVYEGQITDDSELEMAMLHAIIEGQGTEYFPLEIIARKYIDWFHSIPFDIGFSIQKACSGATDEITMMQNAEECNFASKSNGSLMRAAGLAVFCWNRSHEIIFTVSEMEARLSHPNPVVHRITGIYCVLIAEMVKSHVQTGKKCEKTDLIELVKTYAAENPTVDGWAKEGFALTDLDEYNAVHNAGYVKHAFILVVYFLNNIEKYTYETAVIATIMCGGDTDTNAKIVGNMVAAYYSVGAPAGTIPGHLLTPVLEFDCTKVENNLFRRPREYSVKEMVKTLGSLKAETQKSPFF